MTNQRWFVVGVVVTLGVLISCSGTTPPVTTCSSDPDCQSGFMCREGECVSSIVPGCTPATETCNGVDDDCDGTIDEGVGQVFFADRDGDGHGNLSESQTACSAPTGWVTSSDDCNDAKPSVKPGAEELCAAGGVDEDCDGTVDEGCGCPSVGMTMACCSGRGVQTCEGRDGGEPMYSACSASVGAETCNGIDDDCDGQIDEELSFATDAGFLLADGGLVAPNGTCSAGVGRCRDVAGAACLQGAITCSVVPLTPNTETCNGVDDDCDGQVDEGTYVTCYSDEDGDAVATSTGGTELCPDLARAAFGNCPLGFVATAPTSLDCAPQDSSRYRLVPLKSDVDDDGLCVGGLATEVCIGSTAPTGQRIASMCPEIDDCDDTVSGSVRVSCYVDRDNDGVASPINAVVSVCPDPSRAAFGNCPGGTINTAQATEDCAPLDPTKYRMAWTRGDADFDGHCAGAPVMECIGATPPSGRVLETQCVSNDDCNDANATLNIYVNVRADADQDGFCVGASVTRCSETVIPPSSGVRNITTCSATDDCNDANATQTTLRAVRTDADNDGYCTGATVNACQGPTVPAGVRMANSCLGDDCADTNASAYRTVNLRNDADNDAFCEGTTTATCIGANVPAGKRMATSCSGDDCKDDNPYATSPCSFSGYRTTEATKSCGIGPPPSESFTVTPTTVCPTGFSLNSYNAFYAGGDMGGTGTATSPTTMTLSCGALTFGTFRGVITGTCVAN